MTSFVDALAADGPAVVGWLDKRGLRVGLPDTLRRRTSDWERGGRADFYALDRIMCHLGLHVSELPVEVWLEGGARGKVSTVRKSERRLRLVEQERMCEGCGDPIPLRLPGGRLRTPEDYALTRFCSNTCRWGSQQGASERGLRLAA